MATINEMLDEEIRLEIDGLKTLSIGSEEAATAVDNICKLNKMLQEDKKIEYDLDNKIEQRKIEEEKNKLEEDRKTKLEKKDWIFKVAEYGVKIAGIVLPAVFYGNWMKRGFEFEQNGILCSKTFMGFANKIPKP